jgi:methyl-accepting chemotaxis protein
MYWILMEMNRKVSEVDDGEFDVEFSGDRVDDIGEIQDAFTRMASSLGETIEEAEQARREARRPRNAPSSSTARRPPSSAR